MNPGSPDRYAPGKATIGSGVPLPPVRDLNLGAGEIELGPAGGLGPVQGDALDANEVIAARDTRRHGKAYHFLVWGVPIRRHILSLTEEQRGGTHCRLAR